MVDKGRRHQSDNRRPDGKKQQEIEHVGLEGTDVNSGENTPTQPDERLQYACAQQRSVSAREP